MNNIDYIKKRIIEIFEQYYDECLVTIKKHEKTYTMYITLKGVTTKSKRIEIDKDIESTADIINKVCNMLED